MVLEDLCSLITYLQGDAEKTFLLKTKNILSGYR